MVTLSLLIFGSLGFCLSLGFGYNVPLSVAMGIVCGLMGAAQVVKKRKAQ